MMSTSVFQYDLSMSDCMYSLWNLAVCSMLEAELEHLVEYNVL